MLVKSLLSNIVQVAIGQFNRNTFYILVIVLLFPIIPSLSEPISLTKEEETWIKSHKNNIRLGIHEYPPLVTKDKLNNYSGFSIEYIRIIEKKLGMKFKIIEFDSWNGVLENAKKQEIDVVFAIQETPERKKFLIFTEPYLKSSNHIIARKGSDTTISLENLSDKKIAIVENSAVHTYLKEKYPYLILVPVRDELNALANVSTGEADFSIGEISRISFYFRKELFSNLTILNAIDFQYNFRFGINKNMPILKSIMEKALNDIDKNEHSLIVKHWIEIHHKRFYETMNFWISLISFLIVSIIISIIFWNRRLNTIVIQRTSLLKESEEKHKVAREQAEAGNRSKSLFLANMSHELRTPLNGIIGFTDLLNGTTLDDTQSQYLEIVSNSSRTLLNILNDILEYSNIESGKLEISTGKINVSELVKFCTDSIKPVVREKNLTLLEDIPDSLPKYIYSDEIKLRKIIISLLSNAVKFTSFGEIEIKVEILNFQKEENKALIQFLIRDTGIGILEENQKKIFETFSQVDESFTRKYGGTGLGLALSSQLLKLLNSSLKLNSEFGKGSIFYFSLDAPITFEENQEKYRGNNNISYDANKNHHSKQNKITKTIKILIVEDDEINLFLAKTILSNISPTIQLFEAKNGIEAIKLFQEESPAIIFMDLQMPEMTGLEATSKIRKLERNTRVPIILITAQSEKENSNTFLESGVDDFEGKPMEKDLFERMLKKWLPNDF